MSVIEAESETKTVAEAGATLPIREVAQRTGVNPVTLRAWERRYGLLVPERTGKGHRLYSEADVQRIEEIQAWLARGVAIGKVRPLLVRGGQVPETRDSWSPQVEETWRAVERFAVGELRHQVEQLLASYPHPLLLDRWLVPLHRKMTRRQRFGDSASQAVFWQLLSEQLAIGLHAGRKNLYRGDRRSRKKLLLLSFPGASQQAFAQLFCAALIAAGFDAIHLGPDIDLGEIALAEEKLGACGTICYSHNALPMAVLSSGIERALRALRGHLWLAGGIVDLQRRGLQRLARHEHCSLLPGDSGSALQQLREQLQ